MNNGLRHSVPTGLFVFSMVMILGAFSLIATLLTVGYQATLTNRQVGLTNQTYSRIVACLASQSPTKRTPEYTKSCYEAAIKKTGIDVDRFGDGK